MATTEPVVVHAPERDRFEILVGDETAGIAAYLDLGDQRVFYHTKVEDAYAGQGLAGTLVREALTATRDADRRIVPVCPYVRKWVSSHAEEAGLASAIDEATPEATAAAERAMAGERR